MIRIESQAGKPAGAAQAEQVKASVVRIQRRQWWLWSSTMLVTLLLALGVASFSLPGLLAQAESFYSFYLSQAVRGLVGLVLLFNVYTVYQQLQIHRIQRQLADQVSALATIEGRTDEVYKLAALDPLTGLYNRRSGEKRLGEEIMRSNRNGYSLTVLMIDLNDLKYVNDKFGHAAGDELIRNFTQRLNKAIRGSDVAARLGGDEFLALLPECKPEQVQLVLGRLNGLKMNFNGQTIPTTFSAGWTNYIPGEGPEDLLKRADDALYIDKRRRKQGSSRPTFAIA
jgi:diguanylate cyclase (GGDEF)-like protein